MRHIDRMICRVLMPLGQTIVHFPQSMQFDISLNASASLPLCRFRRTFLTLIPENPDAGHVALHEPHAMQRLASGSILHNSSNLVLSTLSRFIAELGDILNPNMLISRRLSVNVYQVQLTLLLQVFQEPSSDLCMPLHRRYLS